MGLFIWSPVKQHPLQTWLPAPQYVQLIDKQHPLAAPARTYQSAEARGGTRKSLGTGATGSHKPGIQYDHITITRGRPPERNNQERPMK